MSSILERLLGITKEQADSANALCYLARVPEVTFAEEETEPVITVTAFKLGETVHDNMGVPREITSEFAEQMLTNFKKNARGIEIITDWEHGTDVAKGKAASGQVLDMRVADDVMEWDIKLTPEAADDLRKKRYRYFSPTWLPKWMHNSTKEIFQNVAVGGGFTNKPIQKTVPAVNFAEAVLEKDTVFEYTKNEDGELTLEARPDEREPGTYGNPDNEDPRHTKNDQSAGEPPPPNFDWDTEVPNQHAKDGEKTGMDEAQLKALREKLGLPADAKDEDIVAKADEVSKAAVAFAEHQERVSKQVAFAEAYPEQHAWIQEKKEEERQAKAVEFAESFRVTHDGKTFVPVQQNQDKLKEMHLKFSGGEVAFAEVQNAIQEAISGELVELGERGTKNGENDGRETVAGMSYEEAGVQFAEFATQEILEAKKEKEEIDFAEGMKRAAEKHPEIAKKYYESIETGDRVAR